MECAPIIIPTLNRCKHLKECIESLAENALAKETELFISIDYPPNEKYVKGYREVVEYVNQGIIGFKEVHLFFQETNLGASANSSFLRKEILKKYDTFIFTEDDNIFSPNFLDFINQGLEKYKNSEEIFAICGHSAPVTWDKCSNSIIKNRRFCAWGYATWKDKRIDLEKLRKEDIQIFIKNPKNAWKLFRNDKRLFMEAVHIARNNHYLAFNNSGELRFIDYVMGIYINIKDMYVLMPVLSLVKNNGWDGSGLNCSKVSEKDINSKEYKYFSEEIDDNKIFIWGDNDVREVHSSELKQFNMWKNFKFKEIVKAWIHWILIFIGYYKM